MNQDNTRGFTLIELMLSMTFISVLLIMIAMTTIQISHIYNKGLTLREVNQVGRTVSGDLQRSISSSVPFDVTKQNLASPSPTSRYVDIADQGGRLCVGRYAYAWNYGTALRAGGTVYNEYTGSDKNTPIRFIKVNNPSASLCADPTLSINKADATEMLSSGDRDLTIHVFTIAKTANEDAIGQALYAISMTIGTNDQTQLTTNNTSCRPPSEGSGNQDYCSVNQFDIVARAGNTLGKE